MSGDVEVGMGTEFDERSEKFLFGTGLTVNDYFIEMTPVSEMVCYRNAEGSLFDLVINDAELNAAVIRRLRSLDVRVETFE